jgi:hypothetical protein
MASCGKCGYQVRGISTLNCPECGADLREVGITKSKSSNAGIWIAVVLVVIVGMVGLCLVSGLFFWMAAPSTAPMTAPMPRPMVPIAPSPAYSEPGTTNDSKASTEEAPEKTPEAAEPADQEYR